MFRTALVPPHSLLSRARFMAALGILSHACDKLTISQQQHHDEVVDHIVFDDGVQATNSGGAMPRALPNRTGATCKDSMKPGGATPSVHQTMMELPANLSP